MIQHSLEQSLAELADRIARVRQNPHLPEPLIDIVSRTVMLQMESLDRIQNDLSLLPPKVGISPEQHEEGEALVERRAFTFLPEESGKLFGKLLGLFKAVGTAAPRAAQAADAVHQELAAGRLAIAEACKAVIQDDAAWFAGWAARMPEAPDMVRFLAQASITPSINMQSLLLAQEWQHGLLLRQDRIWEYGICPICGSVPLLAHLGPDRGDEGTTNDGTLHCTCSFCRHTYRVRRVQCPFCLEQNTNRLEILLAEEYPDFQVQGCDTCGCYLKITDKRTQDAVSVSLLLIDDLESLALDMLAANEGFRRPSRSAWGF